MSDFDKASIREPADPSFYVKGWPHDHDAEFVLTSARVVKCGTGADKREIVPPEMRPQAIAMLERHMAGLWAQARLAQEMIDVLKDPAKPPSRRKR